MHIPAQSQEHVRLNDVLLQLHPSLPYTFEAKLVDIGSEQLLMVVVKGSRLEVFSVSAPS
jgi:hypothetical protein